MIAPEKHLDLDLCVLRAGAFILSFLRRARVAGVEDLRSRLVAKLGSDGELIFMPTINFLFLIGKIDYHPKADSVEYIESNIASGTSSRRKKP